MENNSIQKGSTAGMVVYQLTEAQIQELAASIAREVVNAQGAKPAVLPAGDSQPVWISREDAAKKIGISLASLHGLMNKGAIVFQKSGRRTLINAADLMEKLASGKLAKYKRMQ